jgi:nitrogen fixation/metabolism regulation signal transduction histidine kinase
MAVSKRITKALLVLLMIFGVFLWLLALLLFSQVAEDSDDFAQALDIILPINLIGIAALGGLIIMNLVRLVRDQRRHVPGVRLKVRMVSLLVILAVTPLVVVYLFSLNFINRGIDNWFNLDVDETLDNAIELSQTALDVQRRASLARIQRIGERIALDENLDIVMEIHPLRAQIEASELTLWSPNNEIIATSSDSMEATVAPRYPSEEARFQVGLEEAYVVLEPRVAGEYEIRAAVSVRDSQGGEPRMLFAVFPVDPRLGDLANAVESSGVRYDQLAFLRQPLKASFTLTLSLVLLISVLASVYGAFFSAQRLVVPIQQLMQGTRAVARGDFDTQLPTPAKDEIGFLVNSFNDMTQRLAQARRDASTSQHLVETERQKLEVILAGLTTGVVSLEPDLRIRTANQAAGAILGADLESQIGRSLSELATSQPLLAQFLAVTLDHLRNQKTEWREQIALQGEVGRRVLMCACTALPEEGDDPGGYVIVFDDITALLQAQRDAAWGEVARRLAHEIKNPLTPIQLSAERLRRRYLSTHDADPELLDRATHTIIQQVEAMKAMVDAFSQYARTPEMELSQLDLNEIIAEVMELYRTEEHRLAIELDLDDDLPVIDADAGRLRQLFHNLMRNAIEATEAREAARVEIRTRATSEQGTTAVEIIVADNGPGFSSDLVHQAFDPYVTSKAKGTGLGLAIVKKIVEEHGGAINASNREAGGAEISILLPISGGGALLSARYEQRRERA